MNKKTKISFAIAGALIPAAIIGIGVGVGIYQTRQENPVADINSPENKDLVTKVEKVSSELNEIKKRQEQVENDYWANANKIKKLNKDLTMASTEEERKTIKEQIAEATKLKKQAYDSYFQFQNQYVKKAPERLPLLEKLLTKNFGENGIIYAASYISDLALSFRKGVEKVQGQFMDDEEISKYKEILNSYLGKFLKINRGNLDNNTTVWLDSVIYVINSQQWSLDAGLNYLGATFNWGPGYTFIAGYDYDTIAMATDALQDVPAPKENATDEETAAYNKEKARIEKENSEKLAGYAAKSKKALNVLKKGLELKAVPSKVFIKNNVGAIISKAFWNKRWEAFQASSDNEWTIDQFINFDANKNQKDYTDQDWVTYYVHWYANDYYNASTYGQGQNESVLKIYKNNTINELERHISINVNGELKTYYGFGWTQKDMDQKEVGIGYMPGTEGVVTGQDIFKNSIKLNTTSELTAQDNFDYGWEQIKKVQEGYKYIANKIATLITGKDKGEWKPTFTFDDDDKGPNPPQELTLVIRDENGNINLPNFYKWLNNFDFRWGFVGDTGKPSYSEEFKEAVKTDPTLAPVVASLNAAGYGTLIEDGNKDQKYGEITNENYYYGAISAYKEYLNFKNNNVSNYYLNFFAHPIGEYSVVPIPIAQSATSPAAYFSRGNYYFSPNPYNTVNKWDATSLATHESIMGHHAQYYYFRNYYTNYKDKDTSISTPERVWEFTSYAEGWALFTEWFAGEIGVYGVPDYESEDYSSYPINFKIGKGITGFIQSEDPEWYSPEQIKKVKDLGAGAYWRIAGSMRTFDNEKEQTLATVELTNMLQYIGQLNEAQLRNMRSAMLPILAGAKIDTKDSGIKPGASMQEIKNFYLKNSSINLGTISSELGRSLSGTGQPFAYNAGKIVFVNTYDKIRKELGLTRSQFINQITDLGQHGNIKKLFDVWLRNGEVPMTVIEKASLTEFGLDKNN